MLTKNDIKNLLGADVYARAQQYYSSGRVLSYEETELPAEQACALQATVQGTRRYTVLTEVLYETARLRTAVCSCSYNGFGEGPLCKHIGAVLLDYVEQRGKAQLDSLLQGKEVQRGVSTSTTRTRPYNPWGSSANLRGRAAGSDAAAQGLIEYYKELQPEDLLLPTPESARVPVTLEPELLLPWGENNELPTMRLRIGFAGKTHYVVKEIDELLQALEEGETVEYGQSFAWRHDPADLTERSAAVLELLQRQRALADYAHTVSGRMFPRRAAQRADRVTLAGPVLDALFDLYLPDGGIGGIALHKGGPAFSLDVAYRQGGMTLHISPRVNWFAGGAGGYYFDDSTLWRVGRLAYHRMEKLLGALCGHRVFFTPADAAAFCAYVLPEIKDDVTLNDPRSLLLDQIPQTPVIRYYLDAPTNLVLTGYPEFVYGEFHVSPFGNNISTMQLHRDFRAEKRGENLLAAYMQPENASGFRGTYKAETEEEISRLLETGVPALMQLGEVYTTEKFRSLEAPRPRITVGVSVLGNVLDLDVDTGEFPAEELRALLDSLHQKKRYYRLRDGRMLKLDGSLQALDGLAETLELAGTGLDAGHAQMPLYRAPSLDRALSGDEGVRLKRDDAFRRISRSFHSVADSDFALPESLQPILRNYQRTGFRWLKTLDQYRMGGILADDMGLGKTVQVLAYLLSVKQEGAANAPSLIVCPASLVLNWLDECHKFTPELSVLAVDGTAAQRATLAAGFSDYDLIVTSYDLLRRDAAGYADKNFYACILDEAQAVKNHTTQKYKAVCKIRSTVRFALTGTPVENRLSELWSIFSFLMPGYLYPYKVFREKLEKPIVQDHSEEATRRLNQMTAPFILRRMKADVLKELPPKMENLYRVEMGTTQRKLYLAAVVDAREKLLSAKEEDRIAVFAVLTRLRQICCDPRLIADNYDGESAKLEACCDLLDSAMQSGHQVLLFSQFTSMLSLIAKELDRMEISYFRLEGSTPKPERAELVRRFNEGGAGVFLISLKAGGTGLNLTAADMVIHYDPWWNVAAQNQATDRAYRIGQVNTVQVYKLICEETIEEKILEMQQTKQDLAETVTGNAEGSIMQMSNRELLGLLD